MKKYKYKEGDRINFDLNNDGVMCGKGIIVGCAGEDLPEIGRNWIIQLESPVPFDKNVYPFSCITVFDCQITNE